jgi:DNA-binding beta-propeller fold protein YncE
MKAEAEEKNCSCGQSDCLQCGLPVAERLNYFTGQFLAERDFQDEQNYFLGKHRAHNHYLHGTGTVCGLKVVPHPSPECRDRFVIIEPGLALDCCGNEIVVREKVVVDIAAELAGTSVSSDSGKKGGIQEYLGAYGKDYTDTAGTQKNRHLTISLCYNECKTEFVPALFSECGCDETRCDANRIAESFTVKVERVAELPSRRRDSKMGLEWVTTLNLRGALRVALDATNNRLFVLTLTGASGNVLIYDSGNHYLVRSLDLMAQPIDMAISPDGRYLYVTIHKAGTPEKNYLRIYDLNDVYAPLIKDVDLADGPLSPASRVVVSYTGGRVHVLDPNSTSKKVKIWNPPTTDAIPAINITTYGEAVVGNDPKTIAVSPNGIWLFVADGTTPNYVVSAFKVTSLGTAFHTFNLGDAPADLAVSGDNSTLAVATTNTSKVQAFKIQEAPSKFPEIGNGADVGATAVSIVVSATGRYAFVLVRDANQKGTVLVVDVSRLESDPAGAVSIATPSTAYPSSLLLSPDGERLYAAGTGYYQQLLGNNVQLPGGVAVFDLIQQSCGEIFWKALDGCPACSDDCVLLAAVANYSDGMMIEEGNIENRLRSLVPSAETLRQVLMCVMDSCCKGQNEIETAIPGLAPYALPQAATAPAAPPQASSASVEAVSWQHNQEAPFAEIQRERTSTKGLVVRFNREVDVREINEAKNALQVLIPDEKKLKAGLISRNALVGDVIAVEVTETADTAGAGTGRITKAKEVKTQRANAVAFVFDRTPVGKALLNTHGIEMWVALRGGFLDRGSFDSWFQTAKTTKG